MILESGIVSLGVQAIVGVIDALALTIEVEPGNEILRDLLKTEFLVQCVEFTFYLWLIFYLHKASKNITPIRYADWSITTPLMLITLMAFLKHRDGDGIRFNEFIHTNWSSIVYVCSLNAVMLLFGLLGEFHVLSTVVSTALGFVPFAMYFYHIYENYLPKKEDTDKLKKYLFYWFVFFWALYGAFALTSYRTKNIGYNILDLFAKNFFGLFLGYTIWTL